MGGLVAIAIALAVWLGQGSAPDRVVLLPGPDGKVGRVVVSADGTEKTLDTAYAGAEIESGGRIDLRTEDEQAVRLRYGAALDARPPRPVSYIVYFASGGNELTPESLPVFAELKKELALRPAPEITVIGHTDRVGATDANDALSLKRAGVIRDLLIKEGLAESSIEAAGRGEREPLVPTADEVDEPRNRRVEINLR